MTDMSESPDLTSRDTASIRSSRSSLASSAIPGSPPSTPNRRRISENFLTVNRQYGGSSPIPSYGGSRPNTPQRRSTVGGHQPEWYHRYQTDCLSESNPSAFGDLKFASGYSLDHRRHRLRGLYSKLPPLQHKINILRFRCTRKSSKEDIRQLDEFVFVQTTTSTENRKLVRRLERRFQAHLPPGGPFRRAAARRERADFEATSLHQQLQHLIRIFKGKEGQCVEDRFK